MGIEAWKPVAAASIFGGGPYLTSSDTLIIGAGR